MASELRSLNEYEKSIIEKMEKNLSLAREIYGKKSGNDSCPVLKKAEPMITYILNKETEAYYSFRKGMMLKKAGKEFLADTAVEGTGRALEEANKAEKELRDILENNCPRNNASDSCTARLLTMPKETAGLSDFLLFDAKKLI